MKLKRSLLILLFLAGSAVSGFGQEKKKEVFGGIPQSLQAQLIRKLDLFTQYQRDHNWEKVKSLLTDFRMSSSIWKTRLTEEQIENMLKRVKESPVIKFNPKETLVSTAHLSRPLHQRDWMIWGCAEYLKDENTIISPAVIWVNLRDRQWRLSNFNISKTDRFNCDDNKQPE